jgi:lantibiotic modifying enzyme
LPRTSLSLVLEKVASLGALDRADQEWVIRATLASRSGEVTHSPQLHGRGSWPVAEVDPQRLVAAARGIGDELVARARADDSRVNWIGLQRIDNLYWTVQPLGADLGHGYSGVALFLAQLAALTGVERYADFARLTLTAVPRLLQHVSDDVARVIGCGGFAGLGGMAYALARAGQLLSDEDLIGWAARAVELADHAVDETTCADIIDGQAGCLAAMLGVHTVSGLPIAWRVAQRCAALLSDQHSTWVGLDSGFAHGRAGVAWAMRRFAEAEGTDAIPGAELAACPQYGERDRSTITRTHRRTPDPSWCQGISGLAVAFPAHLDRSIEIIGGLPPLMSHTLCHGELGCLDPIVAAAQDGHPVADAVLARRGALLLGSIEDRGPRCATPEAIATPGLLDGLAGIGYGLLRLACPDRVPSVLLLAG